MIFVFFEGGGGFFSVFEGGGEDFDAQTRIFSLKIFFFFGVSRKLVPLISSLSAVGLITLVSSWVSCWINNISKQLSQVLD